MGRSPSADAASEAPTAVPVASAPACAVQAAIEAMLGTTSEPLLLAVSGGRDSMALLHAMHRWAPERVAVVATYDHGTGAHATEAAALVAATARTLGFTVVRERAWRPLHGEAAWRAARWAFLHRVAKGYRASIVTAHTRDDQIETVLLRFWRGSGARGLAALAAPSPVLRPWLALPRTVLAQWVADERIPYVEDPTNADPRFLRSRLRHGIIPALDAASPGWSDAMVALAGEAGRWRRQLEAWLDARAADGAFTVSATGQSVIASAELLESTTDAGRGVLWPAICARIGVTLDADGTRAAMRFGRGGRIGAQLELPGGARLLRRRGETGIVYEARRSPPPPFPVWHGPSSMLPSRLGGWRFQPLGEAPAEADVWCAPVPSGVEVTVRAWQPADRIRTTGAPAGRRLTRYLSEAHVPAPDRSGWPVVVVEDEPVWVPGVCRGNVAADGAGSSLIWYRCRRDPD